MIHGNSITYFTASSGIIALVLHWYYIGNTLVLHWYFIAILEPWYCIGIVLLEKS
jgi:hypothetical protein